MRNLIAQTIHSIGEGARKEKTVTIPLGLYIHVPFCAHACDFCAFYHEEPRRAEVELYLATLERDLALRPPDRPPRTAFIGGGTPGLLPAADLTRLGQALRKAAPGGFEEWTIELAPATVRREKIAALMEAGVNRFSLGVQSFAGAALDRLGRRQTPAQVEQAMAILREEGAVNWNLDLMFGWPGQTLEDWAADLRAALERQPTHISTYCLTFEEDTALWARLQAGLTKRRSEDEEAAFYEIAIETLEAGGFRQYEISNFARPGYACRHNEDTWAMGEWLGYGPAAASQHGGWRYANPSSLMEWRAGLEAGRPVRVEEVRLDDTILAGDGLVFGLRRNLGVDLEEARTRFPNAPYERLEPFFNQLQEEGLLTRRGQRISLTRRGRLVADAVARHILSRL